jgi:23S rRNA (cytidine1920-2'-O)/16S rRNA (cytidine1409-2'-O)-methyltransferase
VKKARERLDLLLVERGMCETVEIARAVILAGEISVNGEKAAKSGEPVPCDCVIEVKKRFPYVGRGALKLIEALDHFKIDPAGKTAIDIGASTGGFTQVLLERGASKVYAVDSGTNQLDWLLRRDPRVTVMENTNARYLTPEMFPEKPEIAVIDVSFISITKILKAVKDILTGDYVIIALVKPQFELEREYVGPGGVADPAFREQAVSKIIDFASGIGLEAEESIESPITGLKSGNVEYLAVFRKEML